MNEVRTSRLILRPPTNDDDIAFVTALLGDKNRTRYLFRGRGMDAKAASAFIKQHFTEEQAPAGMGVLAEKRSGQLVGFAGIIPTACLGDEDGEFGFVLSREAEGKGYATEIGQAQIDYAFQTLRLTRILALAHPENAASVHVLRDKLRMNEIVRLHRTRDRGPRIVFCRTIQ